MVRNNLAHHNAQRTCFASRAHPCSNNPYPLPFSHMLLSFFRTPFRSERTLWLRLTIAGVMASGMVWLMQSGATDAWFPYPLVEQTAPTTWAFILPWMLFLFLGLAVREDVRSRPSLHRPSFEQSIFLTIGIGLLLLFSLWLLHPDSAQFAALQRFGAQFPTIGDPLLSAYVGTIILLPILLLPLLFLPFSLLLRHRIGVMLSLISAIGFLLFPVLEALYFGITGPPLVSAVQGILRLLPGGVPVDLNRWQVGYGDFSATVGYGCTEFSSVIFLIGLLGAAFRSLHRRQCLSPWRAVFVLLFGIGLLWLLNVLRIAAIVIIGSYHRAFALTLFHSGIGLILFLAFFLLFVKLSLPFVHSRSPSCHPK